MEAEILAALAAAAAGGSVLNAVIAFFRDRVRRESGHRLVVILDDQDVIVREDFRGTPGDLDAVEEALQRGLAKEE